MIPYIRADAFFWDRRIEVIVDARQIPTEFLNENGHLREDTGRLVGDWVIGRLVSKDCAFPIAGKAIPRSAVCLSYEYRADIRAILLILGDESFKTCPRGCLPMRVEVE